MKIIENTIHKLIFEIVYYTSNVWIISDQNPCRSLAFTLAGGMRYISRFPTRTTPARSWRNQRDLTGFRNVDPSTPRALERRYVSKLSRTWWSWFSKFGISKNEWMEKLSTSDFPHKKHLIFYYCYCVFNFVSKFLEKKSFFLTSLNWKIPFGTFASVGTNCSTTFNVAPTMDFFTSPKCFRWPQKLGGVVGNKKKASESSIPYPNIS